MHQENYTLNVYNPASGQNEDISVTEAVYDEYRRGNWRIRNNNRRFRKWETVFADLTGDCERFCEFCSDEDDPVRHFESQLLQRNMFQALAQLSEDDRALLRAVFGEGKSERQVAAAMGLPYMTIHCRKIRLLQDIKIFLDF